MNRIATAGHPKSSDVEWSRGSALRGCKVSVLGVAVDPVAYEEAVDSIVDAASCGRPLAVSALAVHGVMMAVGDSTYRRRLNDFDLVLPDGQPVRWALNALHQAKLTDRVRGTDVSVRVLRRAAARGLPVFLYGSTSPTLERMRARLRTLVPDLAVAGARPSTFGSVTAAELDEIASTVVASGARILFVGLGCPRQEVFTYEMRARLAMPILAVGAAFDYIAGTLPSPPRAVQRAGMEWAWRLANDPRRLWRRYLILNPAYVTLVALQLSGLWDPVTVGGEVSHLMERVDG
jgi:N-acetylglucosaminyldiphosphoundecaprenol N-acetyl-beta-D-mannosaminyltransferase